MERDEALALLKSGRDGVLKWNQRREQTPYFKCDLRNIRMEHTDLCDVNLSNLDLSGACLNKCSLVDANLRNANLHGAELIYTDLSWTDLHGADLSGIYGNDVDLSCADLTAANLSEAYLAGAFIRGANLSHAILTRADLRRANLLEVNFNGANLTEANIAEATCGGTIWANVALVNTLGLDQIEHASPSSIGFDTILRSHGSLSEVFLRKSGIPDDMLSYLPSILTARRPLQFNSCFLSYSTEDKDFCRQLYSRMRHQNLTVWFDEASMKWGRRLHPQIDEAIQVHDKIILVLSQKSMKSEWVKTEIHKAFKREKLEQRDVLFPIALCKHEIIQEWEFFDADTGKDLAREIREYYIPGDFQNWKNHDAFETAFAKLLKDLRASDKPNPNI